MATNANVFNSRVTSEALEAKFRQVFPAQAGAELIQDLYASGVIQPVIDFSTVAEGSVLPPNLQTAWDYATGLVEIDTGTVDIITGTGFWLVRAFAALDADANAAAALNIDDGSTAKRIWRAYIFLGTTNVGELTEWQNVVFLRAGDKLTGTVASGSTRMSVSYRQIADVNGNLVNPLGFTFQ